MVSDSTEFPLLRMSLRRAVRPRSLDHPQHFYPIQSILQGRPLDASSHGLFAAHTSALLYVLPLLYPLLPSVGISRLMLVRVAIFPLYTDCLFHSFPYIHTLMTYLEHFFCLLFLNV
ncbi:hypothetical protein DL96DRAFT_1638262 [Flagelloscypha sp. PMI_526]|nr:hypothetical protein DL96DRAFT_1638262 [Flagelloscypha sp. PMI_526]